MEASTDTLLTILITILSAIIIALLIMIGVLIFSIRKLMKKAHHIADMSNQSMTILRNQLVKKAGLIGVARLILKRR